MTSYFFPEGGCELLLLVQITDYFFCNVVIGCSSPEVQNEETFVDQSKRRTTQIVRSDYLILALLDYVARYKFLYVGLCMYVCI